MSDLAEQIVRAFEASTADPRSELFGGSITCIPETIRPELWPDDWRALDVAALSSADWGTLSGAGLRRYLPALLIPAVQGHIPAGITAEHLLTDGLLDVHLRMPLRWQGQSGSWVDARARLLSPLNPEQAQVITRFLLRRRDQPFVTDETRRRIEEALANFWLDHAGLSQPEFWAEHGRLPAPERFDRAVAAGWPKPATPAELRAAIPQAFTAAYPGEDRIRVSDLGCEPFEVEAMFRGRRDWRTLEPELLDRAGLAFLSAEAFRFYLPAFLMADLAGQLQTEDPSFHLSHGLSNLAKVNRLNPAREGDRTWFEYSCERFGAFTAAEARVIADYLRWRAGDDPLDTAPLEAVANFWLGKTR